MCRHPDALANDQAGRSIDQFHMAKNVAAWRSGKAPATVVKLLYSPEFARNRRIIETLAGCDELVGRGADRRIFLHARPNQIEYRGGKGRELRIAYQRPGQRWHLSGLNERHGFVPGAERPVAGQNLEG